MENADTLLKILKIYSLNRHKESGLYGALVEGESINSHEYDEKFSQYILQPYMTGKRNIILNNSKLLDSLITDFEKHHKGKGRNLRQLLEQIPIKEIIRRIYNNDGQE